MGRVEEWTRQSCGRGELCAQNGPRETKGGHFAIDTNTSNIPNVVAQIIGASGLNGELASGIVPDEKICLGKSH